METTVGSAADANAQWHVVLDPDARAALAQLSEADRAAVLDTIALLEYHGPALLTTPIAVRLHGSPRVYEMRVKNGDLRVFVRMETAATDEKAGQVMTLVVEDVVRRTVLRKVFQARE